MLKRIAQAAAHGMYLGGGAAFIGAGICAAGVFFPPLLIVGVPMVSAGFATGLVSAGAHAIITKGGTEPNRPDAPIDLPKQ